MLPKSGAKLFYLHSLIPQSVTQPVGGSTRLSCSLQMPAPFPAAAKRKLFSQHSSQSSSSSWNCFQRAVSQFCGELYAQGLNWKEALVCLCGGGKRQSSYNILPEQKTSRASHNPWLGKAVDFFHLHHPDPLSTSTLPPTVKEKPQWKAICNITHWTDRKSVV